MPQYVNIHSLRENVPIERLCGWGVWHNGTQFDHAATLDLCRTARQQSPPAPLAIKQAPPIVNARSMLWEVGRKVLGHDPPGYPQQIGDCLSFGAKNAIEYVQFLPLLNKQFDKFTTVFPPYMYGCARIFVGGNKLDGEDGAIGAWVAMAVMEYGTLPCNTAGCPQYSGALARNWGQMPGPPPAFISTGKHFLIKKTAKVSTWDDVVVALMNGYPVAVASSAGFGMLPKSDGFHHRITTWGHGMCIIGVDNDESEPYACILNQWGDVHGKIKDFRTGEQWPVGTLRVRRDDVEFMLSEDDAFSYSPFEEFIPQSLPREFFDF